MTPQERAAAWLKRYLCDEVELTEDALALEFAAAQAEGAAALKLRQDSLCGEIDYHAHGQFDFVCTLDKDHDGKHDRRKSADSPATLPVITCNLCQTLGDIAIDDQDRVVLEPRRWTQEELDRAAVLAESWDWMLKTE